MKIDFIVSIWSGGGYCITVERDEEQQRYTVHKSYRFFGQDPILITDVFRI